MIIVAAVFNLVINKGRDYPFRVFLLDSGFVLPLTGYTICFTIKNAITDADSAALYKSETPSGNLAAGEIAYTIPHTTTATWTPTTTGVYDLSIKDPTGIVQTYLQGSVTINASVTQTV